MKLILDTLERARLAASPSDALALADALTDMAALGAAMRRNGWTLDDAASAMDALKDIRDHARTQPFAVLSENHEEILTEDEPGSFAEWLATLERLAQ